MSGSVTIFTNDPSKFHLLATQVKLDMIEAGINTVNVMAAVGRNGAVKNVKKKFTNRNTFTVRQIQFTPMAESKYVKISVIQATLGATDKAPWMARQEEGGQHKPSMGKTLAIPTDLARGGLNSRPVLRNMRVGNISKKRRVHGEASLRKPQYKGKGKNVPERKKITTHGSKSSWTVARAYIAFKHGLLLPYGGNGDERNLFVVTEFHTQNVAKGKGHAERARHRTVAFQMEQVYKFDQRSTMTKPEPWLLPASEKVAAQCQAIFNAQMKKLGK
jgi:hypothetical protein